MSQDDHSLDWDPGKAWLDSFEPDINANHENRDKPDLFVLETF